MREKAKGTVPCSDVRFRLTGRTNSGRSRVAGRFIITMMMDMVPGAWNSHPGASNTRDPESAASTTVNHGASRGWSPGLGKAVQCWFA